MLTGEPAVRACRWVSGIAGLIRVKALLGRILAASLLPQAKDIPMSASTNDGSYDSGRNHLWPAVVAVILDKKANEI